jgi:methyl-accepting chemotaxis protein
MVEIGEQYYKDAEYISDFVNEFKEVEQQLSTAMDNMIKSINEIANSSATSAQATESIAVSAKSVSDKTLTLVKSMEQTKEGCDKLIGVMGKFRL